MAAPEVRRLLITYESANTGASTSAVARDAALGGLFIETTTPLAIGSLLSVELKSPKSDSLSVTLEARVFSIRTKSEGADRPAGMAVRFLDLPASTMTQLQAIFEHHRPPARTQLGVGDEKDALWAAAGGRDEKESAAEPDLALEMAAALVVDGRPTFDPLPPAPPEEPKHPTPRMVPVAAPSQPSSLEGHAIPTTPPSMAPGSSGMLPASESSRRATTTTTTTATPKKKTSTPVVILTALILLALVIGVLFALSRLY